MVIKKVKSAEIRLRTNGYYYTEIFLKTGKRVRRSLSFRKGEEAQAQAALAEVVRQLDGGLQVQVAVPGVLTVQDWGEKRCNDREALGKLCVKAERSLLTQHFYPCESVVGGIFGTKPITEVGKAELIAWVRSLPKRKVTTGPEKGTFLAPKTV